MLSMQRWYHTHKTTKSYIYIYIYIYKGNINEFEITSAQHIPKIYVIRELLNSVYQNVPVNAYMKESRKRTF
jgi:hypothetical protein